MGPQMGEGKGVEASFQPHIGGGRGWRPLFSLCVYTLGLHRVSSVTIGLGLHEARFVKILFNPENNKIAVLA